AGVEGSGAAGVDADRPALDCPLTPLVEVRDGRPHAGDQVADGACLGCEVPHRVHVQDPQAEADVSPGNVRRGVFAVPGRDLETPGFGEVAAVPNAVGEVVVELARVAGSLRLGQIAA